MGTDLFFKGREDGWLQYTKYRGVKVKPNFKMKCNKLLMVLFVHSVLQNLFKRLGFEAFQNVREVFLEALKLIQMKTSFKYDFYLKLSLVTDIALNSDTEDHSPHFYLVYKQSSVTEFEWPGIAEIAPSFCQTYLVFFFRFLLSLLTYI